MSGRNTAFVSAGAASRLGMTWASATPSDAKQTTPAATNTTSSGTSLGQPVPKKMRPTTVTSVTWTTVLVMACIATADRYAPDGSGVPRRRLRMPCSRSATVFIASATNVVDTMLMPAMPGTMTSRSSWLPENTAPNSARKISGRAKLKNAALGLRQNIRRSRRYWRQTRAASDTAALLLGVRCELEVDVLERRTGHAQVAQRHAARERAGRELVQQRGGVVRFAHVRVALLARPALRS